MGSCGRHGGAMFQRQWVTLVKDRVLVFKPPLLRVLGS